MFSDFPSYSIIYHAISHHTPRKQLIISNRDWMGQCAETQLVYLRKMQRQTMHNRHSGKQRSNTYQTHLVDAT